MDYNNYFFAAPQPSYPVAGLPPSPSNSNVMADPMNHGPPVDPYAQQKLDQFQYFDAFNQYNNPIAQQQPPTPQSQHPSSSASVHGMSASEGNDFEHAPNRENRSRERSGSAEDEDMTPAQSRRKAQNRAAQRAFRERKERHVKELEAQVAELEAAKQSVAAENATLKASLHRATTENEILKATSTSLPAPQITSTGPQFYTPTDQSQFYSNVLDGHDQKFPSHRIVQDSDGGRLLAAAAAWDFIMEHPDVKAGRVDVQGVSEILKSQAKCDGQGPVFAEKAIVMAIQDSMGMDSDLL